jgi:CheY-like chemotaxis protein
MAEGAGDRELWVCGVGDRVERGEAVTVYLEAGGFRSRVADLSELANSRPLGVILDLSPHSADGWGLLLQMKLDPATRDIPILPVFLSQTGRVGGVFPTAGFFPLPIDVDYLTHKLTVLGLTEDTETWDLQALIISRKGEEQVARALASLGFSVIQAYTGKEGVALASTERPYLVFSTLMVSDMHAFEIMDKLRLFPQTRNIPFFTLVKDTMKEGERLAMSRKVEPLVRKTSMTRDEFLSYFRKQ